MNFKSDKISTIEAVANYMKDLIRERDRLTASLGCMQMCYSFNKDIDKIINQAVIPDSEESEPIQYGPSPFQIPPSSPPINHSPASASASASAPSPLPSSSSSDTTSKRRSAASSTRSRDPDRYKGHSLMRRILEAEAEERAKNASSLQQTGETGETGETRESPKPEESTKASETAEGSETLSISAGMNYKDVWMKSNVATVVANLPSAQLLKGNSAFMQ